MKTAISIPDALFQKAERVARQLGLSRSELYQRAVAAYIQKHHAQWITERLNEVYGKDPADSGLDPVLVRLQAEATDDEGWLGATR